MIADRTEERDTNRDVLNIKWKVKPGDEHKKRALNGIFSFALVGEKTESVANTMFAELLLANCNSSSSSNSSSQGCTMRHSLNSSNGEQDAQQNQPSSLWVGAIQGFILCWCMEFQIYLMTTWRDTYHIHKRAHVKRHTHAQSRAKNCQVFCWIPYSTNQAWLHEQLMWSNVYVCVFLHLCTGKYILVQKHADYLPIITWLVQP